MMIRGGIPIWQWGRSVKPLSLTMWVRVLPAPLGGIMKFLKWLLPLKHKVKCVYINTEAGTYEHRCDEWHKWFGYTFNRKTIVLGSGGL